MPNTAPIMGLSPDEKPSDGAAVDYNHLLSPSSCTSFTEEQQQHPGGQQPMRQQQQQQQQQHQPLSSYLPFDEGRDIHAGTVDFALDKPERSVRHLSILTPPFGQWDARPPSAGGWSPSLHTLEHDAKSPYQILTPASPEFESALSGRTLRMRQFYVQPACYAPDPTLMPPDDRFTYIPAGNSAGKYAPSGGLASTAALVAAVAAKTAEASSPRPLAESPDAAGVNGYRDVSQSAMAPGRTRRNGRRRRHAAAAGTVPAADVARTGVAGGGKAAPSGKPTALDVVIMLSVSQQQQQHPGSPLPQRQHDETQPVPDRTAEQLHLLQQACLTAPMDWGRFTDEHTGAAPTAVRGAAAGGGGCDRMLALAAEYLHASGAAAAAAAFRRLLSSPEEAAARSLADAHLMAGQLSSQGAGEEAAMSHQDSRFAAAADLMLEAANAEDERQAEGAQCLDSLRLVAPVLRGLFPPARGPLSLAELVSLTGDSPADAVPGGQEGRGGLALDITRCVSRLSVPEVVVRREAELLALSPQALPFWEHLGMSPVAGQQTVVSHLVLPSRKPALARAARQFVDEVRAAFQGCLLGSMVPSVDLPGGVIAADVEDDGTGRHGNDAYSGVCQQLKDILVRRHGHATRKEDSASATVYLFMFISPDSTEASRVHIEQAFAGMPPASVAELAALGPHICGGTRGSLLMQPLSPSSPCPVPTPPSLP